VNYKSYKFDPLGVFQPYVDNWWDNDVDARTKYFLRTMASGLPIIGPMFQAYDNMRYMDDYTRNRGIDYADIKYPSRTLGAQGLGSSLNYVSRNIINLYKEDNRAKRARASNYRRNRSYF
jgi:hypothetical protein